MITRRKRIMPRGRKPNPKPEEGIILGLGPNEYKKGKAWYRKLEELTKLLSRKPRSDKGKRRKGAKHGKDKGYTSSRTRDRNF